MKERKNIINEEHTPKSKPQLCFTGPNAFTARKTNTLNIPSLMKLVHLKEQRKHNGYNIRTKLQETSNLKFEDESEKDRRTFFLGSASPISNPLSLSKNRHNFIDKIVWEQKPNVNKSCLIENELNSSTSEVLIATTGTSRKYYSSLDKCRITTETYDSIKQDIINKIKSKHMLSKTNRTKQNYDKDKEKENSLESISINKNRQYTKSNPLKKNCRYKSQSDSYQSYSNNKNTICDTIKEPEDILKAQRYNEISVADFMEEAEEKLGIGICKKFNEFRKKESMVSNGLEEKEKDDWNERSSRYVDSKVDFSLRQIEIPNKLITDQNIKKKVSRIEIEDWNERTHRGCW